VQKNHTTEEEGLKDIKRRAAATSTKSFKRHELADEERKKVNEGGKNPWTLINVTLEEAIRVVGNLKRV